MTFDVIVRDGLWFDGTGAAPRRRHLGITDGIEILDSPGQPESFGVRAW